MTSTPSQESPSTPEMAAPQKVPPTPGIPASIASLKADATDPEAWYRAACEAFDLRQYHLSLRLLEACLRRDPRHIRAAYDVAHTHFRLGAFEAAEQACRVALELDPGHLPSLLARGHLCVMLGDSAGAKRFYAQALSRKDRIDRVDSGLVHLRLARGDYHAWGCFPPGAPTEQLPVGSPWTPPGERVWRGELASDATLCVYKDGGNGDLFFFARFIAAAAERVGSVVLTAPASHDRLLGSLPGLARIVRRPEEVPDARFAHLWSLPGLLGLTTPDAVPNWGYLPAPREGPRLSDLTRFKVGLAWAGHPNTAINLDRSVPTAEALHPLFEVDGIDWISLQVGYRADEANQLPFSARADVRDFADTAYLLYQLDLVITVDTAVANLAGALGCPTWVMVPTFPELRWGLEGPHTPWYPHARLFRRTNTREWPGVIRRVAGALAEELEGRRAEWSPRADRSSE